jgi:uncharacterized membrane protein YfcA
MIWAIVCLTSLVVAGLALFSGFGLGTLLMPAFALFFPVEVAVAATAVVHLANNLFKVGLIGKWADWSVAARFAVPAAIAAVFGALLLGRVASHLQGGTLALLQWRLGAGVVVSVGRAGRADWRSRASRSRIGIADLAQLTPKA